jgi:hypothetical protein
MQAVFFHAMNAAERDAVNHVKVAIRHCVAARNYLGKNN